jgi:cell division septation protein DedD
MTRRHVTGPVLASLLLAACDGASWSDMAATVANVRVAPEESAVLQVEVVDANGKAVETEPTGGAKPEAPPARPAPAAVPSRAGATAAVQLGAFRDQAAAEAAWSRFRADPALRGLTPRFEKVERAGGSLVRLKAGPFRSVEEAEAVCVRLGLDAWCARGTA